MIAKRPYSRTLLAAFAVLAITVSGAAMAWACTPGANIDARGPTGGNSGPQGSQMTTVGEGFVSGAEVELRVQTENGRTVADLGRTRGPSFTFETKVPSLPDGHYYVVATAPDPEARDSGGIRYAPKAFTVGDPAPSSPGPDPEPSPNPGAGSTPTPGAGSTPAPAPGAGSTPAPAPDGAPTNGNPRSGSPGSPPARPNPGGNTVLGGLPFGNGNANGTVGERSDFGPSASSDRDSVTTLPSGQTVFSGSLAGTGPNGTGSSDGAAGPGPGTASANAPSERSAGGDLRSGLSAETGSGRPALGGGTAESSRSPLVLGMALLGFGLVALVGSAGVAQARRRRAALARARR